MQKNEKITTTTIFILRGIIWCTTTTINHIHLCMCCAKKKEESYNTSDCISCKSYETYKKNEKRAWNKLKNNSNALLYTHTRHTQEQHKHFETSLNTIILFSFIFSIRSQWDAHVWRINIYILNKKIIMK